MTHLLPIHATKLLAVTAAALALVACNKQDDQRTVGQQIDSTIAKAEQKTEQAKAEVKQESAEAKANIEAAADKAAQKVENAGAVVADKVADASITASVNAALARDPSLSALRIDVDTANGAVSLKGTAPTTAARERATQLASAVKGVTSVDNRLEVRG
ncbi:BON domain-containing protein [Aquincola sp. S2]|uniref:BON domain-containing protein n=1 Tax=Pseudaquabacterium terrae TaxID=2732868 RepID=A0ABX2EHR0_9BURK|nr:BON domain-containing protein [Aquabacterium terrae]NRF68143.1 BON domain-containing protein [Aquabacterium terrae]